MKLSKIDSAVFSKIYKSELEVVDSFELRFCKRTSLSLKYRTRAIITRGLYIFYPLFEGQKRFFKEVFSENFAFMYG